jgi:hypothetical protein
MANQSFDPASSNIFIQASIHTPEGLTLFGMYEKTLPYDRVYHFPSGDLVDHHEAKHDAAFYVKGPQGEIRADQIKSEVWNWGTDRAEFTISGDAGDLDLAWYKAEDGTPLIDVRCPSAGVAVTGLKPYGANGTLNVGIDILVDKTKDPQQQQQNVNQQQGAH